MYRSLVSPSRTPATSSRRSLYGHIDKDILLSTATLPTCILSFASVDTAAGISVAYERRKEAKRKEHHRSQPHMRSRKAQTRVRSRSAKTRIAMNKRTKRTQALTTYSRRKTALYFFYEGTREPSVPNHGSYACFARVFCTSIPAVVHKHPSALTQPVRDFPPRMLLIFRSPKAGGSVSFFRTPVLPHNGRLSAPFVSPLRPKACFYSFSDMLSSFVCCIISHSLFN